MPISKSPGSRGDLLIRFKLVFPAFLPQASKVGGRTVSPGLIALSFARSADNTTHVPRTLLGMARSSAVLTAVSLAMCLVIYRLFRGNFDVTHLCCCCCYWRPRGFHLRAFLLTSLPASHPGRRRRSRASFLSCPLPSSAASYFICFAPAIRLCCYCCCGCCCDVCSFHSPPRLSSEGFSPRRST